MTLPLQVRSYMTPLYSQALSAIYAFYDQTRDPSYALAQDVDIYEIMMRDPKIFQGVQERLLSVSGPNWRVFAFNNSKDPADIALAKLVDDALRFVPHFTDSRQRLATAIFRGQSAELMTGKRKMIRLGQDKIQRNWWMFNEPKNIDPRRFTYRNIHETKEDGTKTIRTELWMSTVPMWQGNVGIKGADYVKGDMPSSLMSYGYRKVEHPEWLLRVVYNDEEARLGYGRGLVDCLYFYHWIKQILLREGLQGVERWSQGIVVGTLDPDVPGTPDTQTNANLKTAMLNALSNMRSRHVYVQDKHDDIEVIQGGGEGHQMVMSFIEYVDDCIMGVCTGAVLMSSKSAAGDAGSHARDEQGAKTQNKVIIADQMKIDEDQSSQMIGLWVRQNWKLICECGLQNARMPQIKTIAPKEINPTDAATRYSTIWQANPQIKFRKDDFYENLGETPVNEDEDEYVQGADPSATAAAAGNPANDPSQMMMEGASGGGPPTPAGVAMSAREPRESFANMIAKKISEQLDARERLHATPTQQPVVVNVTQPTPVEPPKSELAPAPAPRTLISRLVDQFEAGGPPIELDEKGAAVVTFKAEAPPPPPPPPPPVPPVNLTVKSPQMDDDQHAAMMAAYERQTEATKELGAQIVALASRENPAPVVNVQPTPIGVHVAAPDVEVNVAPPAPQPAPVVNLRNEVAPTPVVFKDESAKPLQKIADVLSDFFGWFKSKKATQKSLEFSKDKDGNITGAKVKAD